MPELALPPNSFMASIRHIVSCQRTVPFLIPLEKQCAILPLNAIIVKGFKHVQPPLPDTILCNSPGRADPLPGYVRYVCWWEHPFYILFSPRARSALCLFSASRSFLRQTLRFAFASRIYNEPWNNLLLATLTAGTGITSSVAAFYLAKQNTFSQA